MTERHYQDLQKDWKEAGDLEDFGAGLTKIWHTGRLDPFLVPAMIHDIDYFFKRQKRREVDRVFLQRCLNIAKNKNSYLLAARAYLYYGLVLLFPSKNWPTD